MLTLSLVNSPQSITHRFVKRSRLCGAEKSIKIKIVFLGRSQKQKILGPPTDIYIYTAKKCCVFKMFNLQFPLRGILGILSIFLWSKRASRQDRDTHCINTLYIYIMAITYIAESIDQPCKITNSARGQLIRGKMNIFPVLVRAPENMVSRDEFGSPVPRPPAHSPHSG